MTSASIYVLEVSVMCPLWIFRDVIMCGKKIHLNIQRAATRRAPRRSVEPRGTEPALIHVDI